MLLRKIYFLLSPKGRRLARRIIYFPSDTIARFRINKKELIPPKGMTFVGSGNFEIIGDKFFNHIILNVEINPESKILDIGCGIGRIARPFTKFLNKDAEYIGFDIIDYGTKWCNKNYNRYPQFRFECYPLKNDLYNLSARESASDFIFPYAHNKFDLAILISVFTHMQKQEIINYFNQISLVLKHGAYCYISLFIMENNQDSDFFFHEFDDFFLHDIKVKNANVAYKRDFLLKTARESGFEPVAEFDGWWKGLDKHACVDFQDIIIFRKKAIAKIDSNPGCKNEI